MKLLTRLSLLLLVVIALCTSCKKAVPKQIKHIPKNAAFVAGINTKSLQSKIEKNQTAIENIMKSVAGSDSALNNGKQEFEDLKNSGIDLSENFYMSVVSKGGGMGTGTSGVLSGIGVVKDASKLEAYIKKKHPTQEIKKEKDYSYITWQGENMVAWTDDLFIGMSYQQSYTGGMEFDSATGSYNLKRPVNAEMDLMTEVASYFNLKEDQSVASIPEFRDLMQDKSDAVMWINSSSFSENLPLPLPKLKELIGNSFTAASLNFDDGEIDMNTKSYTSPQLRDIYKKFDSKNVDLGMIANYPSNNINGFMVFAFDPQVINAIVKYLEVGGMVDGFLTKFMGSNYTLEEALKSIKGELAFIYSDFTMPGMSSNVTPPNAGMQPNPMPKAKMLLNIPVGDKTQMNRLLDKVVSTGMLVKVNNEYKIAPQFQAMGMHLSVDDKNLIVSSDSAVIVQYKSKSAKAVIDKDVMKDFKDKPAAFYINIESILNGMPANSDTSINTIMTRAKETFKDITAYSNGFNGKYSEGKVAFRFKNEKENSLTSFLNFISVAAQTAKAHGDKMHAANDSAAMPLGVDSVQH